MSRLPTVLGLALLMAGAADPRPQLVELQLSERWDEAFAQTRQILAADPAPARDWGLEYLEGHLLERARQAEDSSEAFTSAMSSKPLLVHHGRYRLALNRYRSGQPEAAADLLVTLLASDPPATLVPEALRLLTISFREGGDCQLLDGWRQWSLDSAAIRKLQAVLVECTLASGDVEAAVDLMTSLLGEDYTDDTARLAAFGLAALSSDTLDPPTALLIGQAFFHHREFARAIPYLVDSLEDSEAATRGRRKVDRADLLYALARSHYWLGQYESAVPTFTQAAMEETASDKKARALFQRGRSFALLGDWDAAVETYEEAAAAAPTDSWAGAALLAAMRLEWRQDHEEAALRFFKKLSSRRGWRSSLERAALFLATSDIVRGRADRAAAWLDASRQARRSEGPEIWYWRGRLAELQNQPDTAVRLYLDLLASDSLHPLSLAARQRLAKAELQPAIDARRDKLADSSRTSDLLRAWLLLASDDPDSARVRQELEERWRRASRTRPYIEMEARKPDQWTIWRQPVRQPEELLLTLGIAETMSAAVRSAFPLDDTSLALAGSQLLAASGLHQRSLYYAEVVSHRLPSALPHEFLPASYRQLLYPRPFGFQIKQQASRFGVDPDLLTAIIREESRFNPMAVSGASARGLTQFVSSTARRLAAKLDWEQFDAADLHQPQIAITLGAAYLAELAARFDDRTGQVVAAYNAGEDLARLWQAYCFSQEPEEYFSKVGFRQTRGYLAKVLKGRAYYAAIYPGTAER